MFCKAKGQKNSTEHYIVKPSFTKTPSLPGGKMMGFLCSLSTRHSARKMVRAGKKF